MTIYVWTWTQKKTHYLAPFSREGWYEACQLNTNYNYMNHEHILEQDVVVHIRRNQNIIC